MSKDFKNLLTAIKTARKHVMKRQKKKDAKRQRISLKSDLKSNSKDEVNVTGEQKISDTTRMLEILN